MVGRAARSGILIYSMYTLGLVADAHRMTGVPDSARVGSLRAMADVTGGEAFMNTNDMGLSMRKMLDGNRVYYVLAYYPPKGGDPKKYREVVVKLRGHPEYRVRTQRGYTPDENRPAEVAATPREKLFREMVAALPATNIGVASAADFLEVGGDDAQATVQVHIDGDRLQYEKQGEGYQLRCEIVSVVFDKDGKIADHSAETIDAALTPAQLAAARRAGYRYSRRLKLKPGLYQVRVGVREVGSELTGTSQSWVEVPDLRKGKLALSSLFIGKGGAAANAAVGVKAKDGRRGEPKVVVGDASFKNGDVAFYRFVVYNAAQVAKAGAEATLKVDVMQDEKPVYEGGWQPLASRAIRSDAKGTEAGGELRLALPPGAYTLRVTVKDARSKKTEQTLDFRIES